jgi:nucleoside-diphosphate-sugar epimerase
LTLNNINYKPTTSYGASKAIGELLVKTQVHNKEWTIIRPTNVWGPNMSEHYRKFLSYVNSRKYFHVAFSDIYKSYSYVANACFYICDYEPIEVKNWVNRFAFYFGVKKPITFPYTLSFLVVNIFDILKNISVLKRVPITKYTFQNILTHYIIENRELHSVTGDLPFNNEEGIKITSKWFKNLN